ncbi:hypothetical protein Smp_150720 [Schistosoma mansoni]|uniref:hypothetical protein n=1 Tax=Schistosoma mansoni TaxID=6183 RepID=UPI00022DC8F2|nr:hypothetical protein Smp_150720 [Schistosoma mansoni]|eukprot:XP_018647786.1 hypothetical protein Smp_150720 [Schistosoma mansoni]
MNTLIQLNSHILRPILINITLPLSLARSLSLSPCLTRSHTLSIIELYTTTGDLMNCNSVEMLKRDLIHR